MSKIAIARTNEISRAEWMKLRQRGIGGSDAAAACGLSRWKSRLMLYLEKTGTEAEDIDNEAMYWGRMMEPILRQEFAGRTSRRNVSSRKQCQFLSCKENWEMLDD